MGGSDGCGFLGISGNSKEFSTKGLDVRRPEPEGKEELSFETADRVLCREEIVPQLRVWNLGVLGVGDHDKEGGSSSHSVGILGAGQPTEAPTVTHDVRHHFVVESKSARAPAIIAINVGGLAFWFERREGRMKLSTTKQMDGIWPDPVHVE